MSSWEVSIETQEQSHERLIDKEIQQSLVFMQEHEHMLKGIEEILVQPLYPLPNTSHDPVLTHGNPPERVFLPDLVTGDNNSVLLRKVVMVFTYLDNEINDLCTIAEEEYFPQLIIFGESPTVIPKKLKAGEKELYLGRQLPFLQELSNFIDRCYAVAVNTVQQLACLYNAKEKLFKTTFHNVIMTPVYSSLARLLRTLITLDSIVLQSPYLLQYWNNFKR